MLLRNGIICITCSNVKEAVAELRRENCDLILTDIQMPETDGFGLLKLLRNSDIGNSRRIPVAAMTARGDGDSGIYVKQGFCGCLHKPFTMNGLLVFISAMVSRSGEPEAEFSFNFSRLLEEITDRKETFVLLIEESGKTWRSWKKPFRLLPVETCAWWYTGCFRYGNYWMPVLSCKPIVMYCMTGMWIIIS